MSRCKSCKKEIAWIRTKAGKNMPVDPGKRSIVTDDGQTVIGRIPHWTTCKTADLHRKKR